jgi:hypothetical protein
MTFDPGGGLPVTLAYALSAVVVPAFLVLPGFGIAWGLGRREEWSLSAVVATAFAFTLFVVGIVALAAHYARLSLTFVLVACAVLFAALTVAGILLGRGRRPLQPAWPGLSLSLIAGALAVYQRPWFAQTADTFYHLAAVRSLLRFDRPMVTDPLYGTAVRALDPTTGVWHTALALVAKLTGLDVLWLWPGAAAAGAAMTVLAFWLLAERVGRSHAAATIATIGFVTLPLELDMRWFGYPNHMSLAAVFLALAAVTGLMEDPGLADAAVVVAAAFVAISLHMASAAVVVLAALFLGLLLVASVVVRYVRDKRWEWRPVASLAATGAVVAAISVASLLPKAGIVTHSAVVGYYADTLAKDTLPVAAGRLLIARPSLFHDDGVTIALAALLGLLAAVPAFGRGDRRALAAFGLAVLPVALLMNPLVSTPLLARSAYLTSRIAILLRFPLYVGIAWGLARLPKARAREPLAVLAVSVALLGLVAGVRLEWRPLGQLFDTHRSRDAYAFSTSRATDIRRMWHPAVLQAVSGEFGDRYPVVAGDLDTMYYLAGLMPVRLTAVLDKHAPLAVEEIDGAQRREDVRLLLDAHVSEDVRREIVARRGIEYVVLQRRKLNALSTFRAETDLFEPIVDSDTLVVFRVKR